MNNASRVCDIDGCERPHTSRGYCQTHYDRWRYRGSALADVRPRAANGRGRQWLESVAFQFDGDECLTWPYGTQGTGYGVCGGKLAHRIVCKHAHGPPPFTKAEARHSCAQGHLGCVNPRHLQWGSSSDNAKDMVAHGNSLKGAKSPMAVLTSDDDARLIRALAAEGWIHRLIGDLFGISREQTGYIVRGRGWTHVHGPADPRRVAQRIA